MNRHEACISKLDRFLFVKGGYSCWRHLVPLAIAALLLLVLSIPDDNLLPKLVLRLNQPGWLWFPAGLLTVVAAGVYVATIYAEVRQAYLWPDGDSRRTIITSLVYILFCALMVYTVLRSVSVQSTIFGSIWACSLVSILSLTGIGWSGPSKWVETIGIKSPDYTKARSSVDNLTKILSCVRGKSRSAVGDAKDFLEAVNRLRSDIEANIGFEPGWASEELRELIQILRVLADLVEKEFLTGEKSALEDFAAACRFEKRSLYQEFVKALTTLSCYSSQWQYQEST